MYNISVTPNHISTSQKHTFGKTKSPRGKIRLQQMPASDVFNLVISINKLTQSPGGFRKIKNTLRKIRNANYFINIYIKFFSKVFAMFFLIVKYLKKQTKQIKSLRGKWIIFEFQYLISWDGLKTWNTIFKYGTTIN